MVGRFLKRGLLASVVVVGLETAYALLRPAPTLDEFDPTGEFGDPNLPELRVAVLGDSSVTGPGVSAVDDIWVSIVCRQLAATRHVVLASFAVGGSMAHDVLREQLEPAILFDPDLVFLSVGANDVIKGVPTNVFERSLDHLVAELGDTGAVVVQSGVGDLGTIPRLLPPLRGMMSRRSSRFDRLHWKVAKRHGSWVVDQRSDDREVWLRDRSLWAVDLFHVSAAGHARWADTLMRTVAPALESASGSH